MRPVDESALATKRSIGQYAESLPLRFTAERGMRATARILLEAGAEPDGRLCEGRATALMMAAAEGHEGIAQMLLDYGAGLESVGRDQTPLEWAALADRQPSGCCWTTAPPARPRRWPKLTAALTAGNIPLSAKQNTQRQSPCSWPQASDPPQCFVRLSSEGVLHFHQRYMLHQTDAATTPKPAPNEHPCHS
ncbi:ankyrin repeat domain-containing protein [Streptomyces niveus]|uniref:ankyrin repeat domain-containing protein n=1 Tax=Streptomyces niveus TaxID=193462 RepID=UPI00344D4FEA